MVRLPEIMPPNFRNSYKPIAAAGTLEQKKQLAKLLATQLAESMEISIDTSSLTANIKQEAIHKKNEFISQEMVSNKKNLQDIYHANESNEESRRNIMLRSNLPTTVRTTKSYKLANVTTSLNKKSIDNLLSSTFKRILSFEGLLLILFWMSFFFLNVFTFQ